jgi:hypothetical protein
MARDGQSTAEPTVQWPTRRGSHEPMPAGIFQQSQAFSKHQPEEEMPKVVCVLYDDPVTGYPKSYARDDIPKLQRYPGGQTLPTPEQVDFKPGELLGSVSGELGMRRS